MGLKELLLIESYKDNIYFRKIIQKKVFKA